MEGTLLPMNYVYLLRCADGSLYCGWTTDINARLAAHNSGQGAKYTRSRLPAELVYTEAYEDRHEALSREWHIKRLSHAEKEKLIARGNQYRHAAAAQSRFYQLHRIPAGNAVKNVTGQEHHVAVFPAAEIGNFAGDLPLFIPQQDPLGFGKSSEELHLAACVPRALFCHRNKRRFDEPAVSCAARQCSAARKLHKSLVFSHINNKQSSAAVRAQTQCRSAGTYS